MATQINSMVQIKSDIGRSRAWLRMSLTGCEITCYLSVIVSDIEVLRHYYEPWAFLCDMECTTVLTTILQGLELIPLKLSYNSSVLNVWTGNSAELAGLSDNLCPDQLIDSIGSPVSQTSPLSPDRDTTFDDFDLGNDERFEVAEMFHCSSDLDLSRSPQGRHSSEGDINSGDSGLFSINIPSRSLSLGGRHNDLSLHYSTSQPLPRRLHQRGRHSRRRYGNSRHSNSLSLYQAAVSNSQLHRQMSHASVSSTAEERAKNSEQPVDFLLGSNRDLHAKNIDKSLDVLWDKAMESSMDSGCLSRVLSAANASASDSVASSLPEATISSEMIPSQSSPTHHSPLQPFAETCLMTSTSTSPVARFTMSVSSSESHHNCFVSTGSLDETRQDVLAERCSLLSLNSSVADTDDDADDDDDDDRDEDVEGADNLPLHRSEVNGRTVGEMDELNEWIIIDNSQQNFVAKPFHVDETTVDMIQFVGTRFPYSSVEDQHGVCRGCRQTITHASSQKCEFSGGCFCARCFGNYQAVIPAKIVFSWDFTKHRVSSDSWEFLRKSHEWPMIDIIQLNPDLYDQIPQMATARTLRLQIVHLVRYMLACQSLDSDLFWRMMNVRWHVFQHTHHYSVKELEQVREGNYTSELGRIVSFATGHVAKCSKCAACGFVCELCNDETDVIYPFDVINTVTCDDCLNVYHKRCWLPNSEWPCGRCLRRSVRRSQDSVNPIEQVVFSFPDDMTL